MPRTPVINGTARKEFSVHNSDAQEFEDLFGFRPNQNEFGVGNHGVDRERIKQEYSQEYHNAMRSQLGQAFGIIQQRRQEFIDHLTNMLGRIDNMQERIGNLNADLRA